MDQGPISYYSFKLSNIPITITIDDTWIYYIPVITESFVSPAQNWITQAANTQNRYIVDSIFLSQFLD